MDKILVVGARDGSLGEAVANELAQCGYDVLTAGISGEEVKLDITNMTDVAWVSRQNWAHVVCTAGVNWPTEIGGAPNDNKSFYNNLRQQFLVNCAGPMLLLNNWLTHRNQARTQTGGFYNHFVVVSSNSAHVPRSTGMGYCASKAALSQAVRCAARAVPETVCVWAVEPGWIADTPMSVETIRRLDPANIMRGGDISSRLDIAELIRMGLEFGAPRALNGMTITMDGGER